MAAGAAAFLAGVAAAFLAAGAAAFLAGVAAAFLAGAAAAFLAGAAGDFLMALAGSEEPKENHDFLGAGFSAALAARMRVPKEAEAWVCSRVGWENWVMVS